MKMNDLNEINKEDVNFKAYPVKVEFNNMLVDVRVNFDADYKMEGHVERHNHSSYEIHFISYGNGSFWIEDSEVLLRKTSLYLLSPKIYHKFVVKNEEQIERYSMQFDFFSKKDR
jgi:cupin superfamily acireductone dioxygenase involved in methionine salvage